MNSNTPHGRSGQPRNTGRFSRPSHQDRFANASNARTATQPFENFARSVSCLLDPGSTPSPEDRDALVDLVRRSFPEFLNAKASLTAAQQMQQEQVSTLGPRLLGNMGTATTEGDEQNESLDEAAVIMWKLAKIDEQIEALSQEINRLQQHIMSWVRRTAPASTRAVHWALNRA